MIPLFNTRVFFCTDFSVVRPKIIFVLRPFPAFFFLLQNESLKQSLKQKKENNRSLRLKKRAPVSWKWCMMRSCMEKKKKEKSHNKIKFANWRGVRSRERNMAKKKTFFVLYKKCFFCYNFLPKSWSFVIITMANFQFLQSFLDSSFSSFLMQESLSLILDAFLTVGKERISANWGWRTRN